MSNALQQYQFNTHQLNVILDDNGEPWFIAKQVAKILEYSDAEAMTRRLDDDEVQNRQIVGFGNRGVNLINESGLYSAILTSRKPEARAFKKWVTSEVLPSIRKTGSYLSESLREQLTQILSEHITLQQKYIQLIEDKQRADKQQFAIARGWTADEDTRLAALLAEGLSCTQIGLQLNRTGGSVRGRLRRLKAREAGQ